MNKEEELFNKISQNLKKKRFVNSGKMMSAPGLNYNKKFFAFYYKNEIILKLGKDFQPSDYGITKWQHLNPFKNKAPMKNWYQFPYSEKKHWEKLAEMALEFVKKESKTIKNQK